MSFGYIRKKFLSKGNLHAFLRIIEVKGEDDKMMKKLFKLNICIVIVTIIMCSLHHVQAGTKTGHKEFNEIDFLYNQNTRLLVELNGMERKSILNHVRRKAFGWSSYTNLLNLVVSYTADTIFSRSNHTNQIVEFNYATTSTRKNQLTKNLSGTLALKTSGKVDDISLTLDHSIRSEIGYKTEISFEEETDFDIKIEPGKKISLIVKGKANLSNGASKFYFFGIPTSQKLWEYVDVINEYYELYEESI